MENLIEELTKVNPANLSEKGLKLFNKINEIIDKNKKLEKQMGKDLDVVYLQGVYNERDRWKSKVREKIEELNSIYEQEIKQKYNGRYYHQLSYAIQILKELEGDK